jgi:hypothetical protein
MAKNAQQILSQLGDEHATILSAKRAVSAIIKSLGGIDEWANSIALLLESGETPSGTKAAIHKALLTAILNINEAEAIHGEVVDQQTEALLAQLDTVVSGAPDDES